MKNFTDIMQPKDGWRVEVEQYEELERVRLRLTIADKVLLDELVVSVPLKDKVGLGAQRVDAFLLEAITTYLNAGMDFEDIYTLIARISWVHKYRFDYAGWFVFDIGLSPADNEHILEFHHMDSENTYYWVTDIFIEQGSLDSYLVG